MSIRVKRQGGIVWMALAMMVKTRLWLGGEVSAQRGSAPDPAAERAGAALRRAARRPRFYSGNHGSASYIRAMRETFRDSVHTGMGGRPRLQRWRHVLIAQVVKRYERRRMVEY